MSSEERLAILKMLSEGKISVDEAEKLLKTVGEETSTRRERPRRERYQHRDLGDLMENIGEEVRQAVKSVQTSDIGRVVSQEVDKAVKSVQQMDIGSMVGEIVEQVKDAVVEAVDGAGAGDRDVVEEMEWTLDGAGLVGIDAETTSGKIELQGTDQNQVIVKAYKKIRAHDQKEAQEFAKEVEVSAVREGEMVRIYKEHPKPPRGIKVEVGYTIECPRAVDVDLRLTNGNAHCSGVEGVAKVQSTNGNIRLAEVSGRIEGRTKNGNVSAKVAQLRHEGIFTALNGNVNIELQSGRAPLTATSTNGNVSLVLPPDFGGRLDAKTTNGKVSSDIELTTVEQSKRNLLVGQLGEGGEAEIRLHTLNGSVHLKKTAEEEQ